MEDKNFIPDELYNQILEHMPIICVDGVVVKDGEILLLLRDSEPEKNKWWFPGGRLLKNEDLHTAVIRKVKEETDLECTVNSFLDVTQTTFSTGINNIPTHTINLCFILHANVKNCKLDDEHKGYGWFDSPPTDAPETIKYIFKKIKQ